MFKQVDKKNKGSMHHFGHGFSVLVIVWLVTRTTFCQETNSSATDAPPTTIPPQIRPVVYFQVRLVDGAMDREGRVEVYYNGSWGTVCDDLWGISDGNVVCRMLGLGEAQLTRGYGAGEGPIILDNVACLGTEFNLGECQHSGLFENNCGHAEDAGVKCSDNPSDHTYDYSSFSSVDNPSDHLYDYSSYSFVDSALFQPQNETCVTGHCYLDSNNVSRCIPVVDICATDVWYRGLACIATPIRPIASTIRCMTFNERAQTNLTKPEVISTLTDKLRGLRDTAVEDFLANPRDLQLLPQHIYDRQRQARVLILLGYEIQHIEDNTFTAFTSLRKLFLSDNKIRDIEVGAFDGLQNLGFLNLASNSIQHLERWVFSGLQSLRYLDLSDNKIRDIEVGAFDGLQNLFWLELSSNSIQNLERGVFSGLQSIETLFLSDNKIRDIEVGAFDGLQNLGYWHLSDNKIRDIEVGVFDGLQNLRYLYLYDNQIQDIEIGVFDGLQNLRYLWLSDNQIRDIEVGVFDGLQNLRYLWLYDNKIRDIEVGVFDGLQNLRYLNLSSNSIQHLWRGVFSGLRSLEFLDLMNNNIQDIEGYTFESLASLQYLFFHDSELGAIDRNTLAGLTSMEKMSTSDNRLCCLLNDNVNFTCARTSPSGPLDTCSRLYPNLALRIAGWFMGLLALGGNGVVLFVRLRDRKKHTSKVQNTMIGSLAMADILMGLYMIIITSADVYYGDEFYLIAPQWRDSHVCRFAGFLGFLSSEASVFTLTLITVDRFINIVFPFGKLKIRHKGSLILVWLAWLFTIVLSLGLVLVTSYRPDIYGLSDVCLGLPLHVDPQDTGMLVISGNQYTGYHVNYENTNKSYRPPWLFSIIIFIGLNLVSFAFILVCYILIFIKASRSSARVRNSQSNKQETKLAFRMALLVATDFACWMPVIIMGILSQTGTVTLDPSLYAWTVILIVPINSSINPFLYTFIMYYDDRKKKKRKSKDNQVNLPEVQTNAV